MNTDLNDKLNGLLKSTIKSVKSLTEQALEEANSHLGNIEDEKQKAFLKDSLDQAVKGELDVVQFLDKLKKI